MSVPGQCANCGAPLRPDRPASHSYCAKCAAAWQRERAVRDHEAHIENDAAQTVHRPCANCGAPLPADQPAGDNYCATCTAAWQRGNATRERSDT